MKIYIKCPNTPSDWFIIELQGEVSIDGEDESFNPSGLKFGDISESNGSVVLKIGQHELKGSIVKFEKPLAVLKKLPASNSAMDIDCEPSSDSSASSTSYEVVGVVRQKYLFKDRPKVLLEPISR
jgi:hypothetical protein